MKRALRPRLEMLEGKALMSVGIHSLRPRAEVKHPSGVTASSGLVVTISTDKATYHVGQPVEMTLTETNNSDQSVSVAIGPSTDGFYVTQGNKTVWRSNAGIQPMFMMLKVIPPHGSFTLNATWNGQSNEAPLSSPTGTFQVHSQIPNAKPVTIHVVAK